MLRCERSGVLFLSGTEHVGKAYYEEQDALSYWTKDGRKAGLQDTWEDDSRRAALLRPMVTNRIYADVGSGLGGVLDLVRGHAREVHAVEPQRYARTMLQELGYPAYASAAEMADTGARFDVVSLFHVFEHLVEPLMELESIHRALAPGGTVVIEVPHARDALLTTYDLEAFKGFTFWSEHLILHTRNSLERYLLEAGFSDIRISGVQRYPLANHLMWLRDGKPGGHMKWPAMRDAAAEEAYAHLLMRMDTTDTLLALATKR